MIIAATGLALATTSGVLTQAIEARYSVQVPNGGNNLEAIVAVIRSSPGVTSVEPVPEQDMRKTLERWLGQEAQSNDLPVPALVNFNARAGANIGAIQQRVQSGRILAGGRSDFPHQRGLVDGGIQGLHGIAGRQGLRAHDQGQQAGQGQHQ